MKYKKRDPECTNENRGEHSDSFVDYFVPVIREMRKKDGKNLIPTMNKCLDISSKALKQYLS